MPKFTTEYRDRRTGLPHLSQIEARSADEAQRIALHRGLGERLTSRGSDCVDRARTAEPSTRLESFLHSQSIDSGLDVLDALAHVAHLASVRDEEFDSVALLSDAGLFQQLQSTVRSVLAGDEPSRPRTLFAQLYLLEDQVAGLPKETLEAPLPVDRRDLATEVRRLRALLFQVAFDLERLSVQPSRTEEDRQALHDRAQTIRWGLSKKPASSL